MVLWTVMPMELVFPVEVSTMNYEQIEFSGVAMQVERLSSTQCRIVRILSTNPSDYLRNDVQPGTMLHYQPVIPH